MCMRMCMLRDLKAHTHTLSELTLPYLKACAYPLAELREAGYTAGQLTAANCFITAEEAFVAGFTKAEMKAAGWQVP